MTFAVVQVAENRERVVGMIWADGESDAQQVATSVIRPVEQQSADRWLVRRAEEREIPFRIMH